MSKNFNNRFPKDPEKRYYQRVDMELPVKLEIAGEAIDGTTENISCGGMFLPNVDMVKIADQNLVVFVNLPEHTQAVKLNGKITRVETGDNGRNPGVAIEFSGLYDDNRLEIDRFIKKKLLI